MVKPPQSAAEACSLPWLKRPTKIAVIGDLILDEYLEGTVTKISPEAPVPVHLVSGQCCSAGGAANVARNVQTAGGNAQVFGILGQDEAANSLLDIMKADGIDTAGILRLSSRPTIKKTRVVAGQHQVLRIDWEKTDQVDQDAQEILLSQLQSSSWDGLLISDYGKGLLNQSFLKKIIQLGLSRGVPVVVDPKGKDFSKYHGASLITPNRKEACEALGRDPLEPWQAEEVASELQARFDLTGVLVTLGSDGMILKAGDGSVLKLAAEKRDVFDVSGAGDTVAAFVCLGLAAGCSYEEALTTANRAAGIAVSKWGTQPVYLHELESADRESGLGQSESKISHLENIARLLERPRQEGKTIVFTNGCFDILHSGHTRYLEKARLRGDLLVVGVNTDSSVRRLKGPSRPIIPCEERMRLLASLGCVDYVVPFEEDTPLALIKQVSPDLLVKGADYEISAIVGADYVKGCGGDVDRIPLEHGLSTSNIIDRIRSLQ